MSHPAFSIEWHRECLGNQSNHLENKKKQLEQLQKEVKKLSQELVFYTVQIHEAERQGKDKFDPDKFMKAQRHLYVKWEYGDD